MTQAGDETQGSSAFGGAALGTGNFPASLLKSQSIFKEYAKVRRFSAETATHPRNRSLTAHHELDRPGY